MKTPLFAGKPISDFLAKRTQALADIVERSPNPRLPSLDRPGVAEKLAEDFTIQLPRLGDPKSPPKVTDRASLGVHVEIEVPFTGTADLFDVRPVALHTVPRAEVSNNSLLLEYSSPDRDADSVRAKIEGDLTAITLALDSFADEVRRFNESLSAKVQQVFETRRQQLAKTKAFAGGLFPKK